ncbi:MAG: class F sortase [Marmoricola sp.]
MAGVAAVILTAATASVLQASSADASGCTKTTGTFAPVRAAVTGVGTVPVIPVGTSRTNQLLSPPMTNAGMHEFGWYSKGSVPGSGKGSVLMDAHSYFPDGTLRSTQGSLALGNALLLKLWKGGTITLSNSARTRHICYIVTSRTQYSPSQVDMGELTWGRPGGQQVGIIVCSGTRSSKGVYSKRTVWIATPVR